MVNKHFENPLSIRQEMASDPHRPGFHFLPPRNWMNDPNGLFYWEGRYHLFYQYNPYQPLWGAIHWGHASSSDLVHWQDHPLALTPGPGGGDAQGCWSGCVVNDDGKPSAIYTGFIQPDQTPVMLARAQDPDLLTWQKSPYNPIIPEPPSGVTTTDFRDPYVWKDGQSWHMALGAGMQNGDSAILHYRSTDLVDWSYEGLLFNAQTSPQLKMWECPNFFKLMDRHVLLVSLFPNIQGVYYYVGHFDGQVFMPVSEGYLEKGTAFYAPHVRQFTDGRAILFAWLLEGRSDAALEAAGWAGVQSLPRELAVDEFDRLISKPARELITLRQQETEFEYIWLDPDEKIKIPFEGKRLEIEVFIESAVGVIGLEVLCSPDGTEKTRIMYNPIKNRVELDTRQSSLSEEAKTGIYAMPLPGDEDGSCTLRVFVDSSVIEVWFNDSLSLTGRAYPTQRDANGIALFATGGEARVRSLRMWEMEPIWPVGEESGR
jgi:beta-fructofuranosidase